MVDFDALRVHVEGVLDSLSDTFAKIDKAVIKVLDEVEKIVEQAQPAAPQEREENNDSPNPNWKMREPYVAPKTGGRTREELERIETMYKYIVEYGPTYSQIYISACPLDWWLNNPDQDATLEIHYRHALIYNKDNVE